MAGDMFIYIIFVLVLGLMVGSFLNVCVYRIPRGESVISPGSHCTSCNTALKVLNLIPVLSYIIIKGRCRYCRNKISLRYSIIELLTAGIFVLLFERYQLSVYFIASVFIASILIAVFFIDMEHQIIPNGLVLVGLIGGIPLILYNLFKPVGIYGDRLWYNPILGMLAGSGILLLVALIGFAIYRSDGAMGMGDVKIFAPIGIFLGWRMTLLALLISVLLGGITGLILILFRVKDRKDVIPFGPFIVIAELVTMIWGWNIFNWYLNRL